jgi:hypothetical protein
VQSFSAYPAMAARRPGRHHMAGGSVAGPNMEVEMPRSSRHGGAGSTSCAIPASRKAYTFVLDTRLVEQARREVGERDVVRSIEAALAAAIDYQHWVREVNAGERDALS